MFFETKKISFNFYGANDCNEPLQSFPIRGPNIVILSYALVTCAGRGLGRSRALNFRELQQKTNRANWDSSTLYIHCTGNGVCGRSGFSRLVGKINICENGRWAELDWRSFSWQYSSKLLWLSFA